MALTDNLVSYWKLDESSGNAADSHGSNTLTNTGTTPYVAALLNNGASFNTTNRRLGVTTNNLSLNWSGDYTWSFWIKLNAIGGYYLLDHVSTAGANRRLIFARASGSQFDLYCGGFSGSNIISTTLSTATWYHFVIVKTGSSWEMFRDLTSQGTATTGTASYTLNQFSIGAASDSFGANANAVYDEMGVWNKAMDSTERSLLYNSGTPLAYADFAGGGGGYRFVPQIRPFVGL